MLNFDVLHTFSAEGIKTITMKITYHIDLFLPLAETPSLNCFFTFIVAFIVYLNKSI